MTSLNTSSALRLVFPPPGPGTCLPCLGTERTSMRLYLD